jgi:hypothetical protein
MPLEGSRPLHHKQPSRSILRHSESAISFTFGSRMCCRFRLVGGAIREISVNESLTNEV